MLKRSVCLLVMLAGCLSAQTFTGNLTGVVTDTSGATAVGAKVTIQNMSTREERAVQTNDLGRYTFSQLLPSTYQLQISLSGFKEYVRTGITLSTNQSMEIDVQLTVGAVSETVEVTATAPLLDSQTANQSSTLDNKAVLELPLNMRNPLALTHTMAGVTAVRTGISQDSADQNQNRFAMNGGRNESVAILVDGISVIAGDWGGALATPGVDAVQEVQVIRNTYEAQFGKTGGGVVNITTKSGGQSYHGSVFEFLRNDNLDANAFFNNKNGVKRQELKRNQFGGTIAGPIWKSKKLQGFFGYEGLRTGGPASRTATLPTALQKAGDFSQTFNADGSLVTIYDPLTTQLDASGKYLRTAFAGNKIPSSRFDPVGLNVAKMYADPNQPGNARTGANNFYGTGNSQTTNNRYDTRVDWARSASHTLFGRFTYAPQTTTAARFFANPALETGVNGGNPRFQATIGNTFVLNPTMVVNVLVGGGRWREEQISQSYGTSLTSYGLPPSVLNAFDVPTTPVFNVSEVTSIGSNRYLEGVRNVMNAQVNVSKEMTRHSIKFGWSGEASQLNFTDSYAPTFSMDRNFTSGPDADARSTTTGYGMASLLLGVGGSGSVPQNPHPASTDPYYAWYVQDTWRVNSKLTLNYGLRYEIQGGRTERYNRLDRFNFDVTNPIGATVGLPNLKGGLEWVNKDERTQWNTGHNFAPRVGVAYKATNKLVVRTGFGIFDWKTVGQGPLSGIDGYAVSTPWVTTNDGGRTPANYLSNPFPGGFRAATGSGDGLLTNVGFGATGFQKYRETPYLMQYSLDIQYELRGGTLLELGYVGNGGRHLSYGYNFQMNQLPDAALSLGSALLDQVPNPFYGYISSGTLATKTVQRGQLLRPFPQFTGVSIIDMPGAASSYNGASVKATKRFGHGVSLMASYQWSKAIDNASENQGWEISDGARDYNNLRAERSVSGHDVPQSVAVAYILELPFGKGRRFGTQWNKAIDYVAGGWQMSGVYKYDSGLPLRFSATNNTYSFGGGQAPNVSDMKTAAADHPTIDRWFNTNAFTLPAAYTFGNVPRWTPNIRTGSVNDWSLALSKTFRVTEKIHSQLRGEFFNLANRVQFGRANTSLGSTTFGQVTGVAAGASPRNIQLGLRVSF
ncbi:carboxypeptidase regulatory-like domain-containing protein [uncultured Paludibaculum sp.]|uniref:carboxypeptidase regulatory-like domain-containing protein n=1 Tax=uncultured Paludibaculum sp. TaxID=1765020 RepID=UPI002AAC0434|nr:carboxypeptidase regulatory-like domain-containing protein [uncultured Paludibaculum sp.]